MLRAHDPLDPLGSLEPSGLPICQPTQAITKQQLAVRRGLVQLPLGSLCARTQAKEIVEKCANWSHQSDMQFGKITEGRCLQTRFLGGNRVHKNHLRHSATIPAKKNRPGRSRQVSRR